MGRMAEPTSAGSFIPMLTLNADVVLTRAQNWYDQKNKHCYANIIAFGRIFCKYLLRAIKSANAI